MTTPAVKGYIRDPSSGAGIPDVTVALKRHNGGTTIASDTTDANGLYEFDRDTAGYEGPTYLQFTKDSTTDVTSGNVVGQIAGLLWGADLPDALALLGIGVGSGLSVSADGANMTTDIAAGVALLKDGMPYVQEGIKAVTHTTADATNPRIDRVVLRLTREGQTDQGKVERVVIAGTPAASPTAPAVTQTSATWDFQLAQVRINAGVTTIAADKVTDERTFVITAAGRALLAAVTAAAQRTALDVPQIGSALTESAEQSTTPVAGASTTTGIANIRRYMFFQLPTTEKWYIITGIEWKNGATVAGRIWFGVDRISVNPPSDSESPLVAWGSLSQAGTSDVQLATRLASIPVRGGALLGAWINPDHVSATLAFTTVASSNLRKDVTAASPNLVDVSAWIATTGQFYIKVYYRGIS